MKSGGTLIGASSETTFGLDDTSQTHRKTEGTACLRVSCGALSCAGLLMSLWDYRARPQNACLIDLLALRLFSIFEGLNGRSPCLLLS